ncbi:hypothetical protein C8A03DRAFT_35493 [Achaetomium macrosporum]|uniref:Uncharacterized protein n=1 Tax=Achaetomium macrosporum TaxID=79813 RepID=A0AAN7C755_9PEZI|nr:hypothetical protein C8A03DRAFT_35493 [Achaetomium macrosporum]
MTLASLIPLLMSLPSLAAANPSLKPWEISRLSTFSPSGRPGSSPWAVVNITISDPNDASVSPAICAAQWNFSSEEPYGMVNACSEVDGGQWTFVMLEADGADGVTPSPTTNFRVRFALEKMDETWVGDAAFVIGENMSGLCSASGLCSFGLKEELAPFAVRQVRVR